MTTTNNTSLFDFTPFSPFMEWNYYLNNTQMTHFSPLDSSGSDDLQVSDFFSFQDYGHHEQQTMDFQQTQSFGCHGNGFFDIGGSSNVQNEGENSNRESIRNIKEKKGSIAFRMKSEMDVVDDGYKWRKYGKKMVKNSPNPRNYYRCAVDGCPVKKRVERDRDDMNYVITTYEANHNHQSQN
ncbi:probable WRKY transcription factor 51 isoform X2 [Amaranthus tricolor]|uniref:probable WRKY transcription factor 51 isoform X2 n=1 Tax=Amaranthus tricolor TaxID=29722 RepID=UPI002588F177|nr:probable WRKY transcription factor 51 isoform X2 [Amaranthus tricolor]